MALNRLEKWFNRPKDLMQRHCHQFKLVLLGASGVGKTSLLVKYTENTFDVNMPITVGPYRVNQTLYIHDKTIDFESKYHF